MYKDRNVDYIVQDKKFDIYTRNKSYNHIQENKN